jgi:type I restriction enzyme S subunit
MVSSLGQQLQQIPEGYKQTEVGLLPEEWELKSLRSVLKENPKYGIGAEAVPLTGRLPVYIRITDISVDGYFRPSKKVGVDRGDSNQYVLQLGDLVFARTGASVGKSYLYREDDGLLVYAGFLIKMSPDPEKLVPSFLFQYVKARRYWDFVTVMSMRSGQPGINSVEYGQLLVPLPSKEEQTAIANALSDVDSLITSLEKLIAKKSAIKTAAMQQLLTGKKRLPPFDQQHSGYKQTELGEIPEDWEVKAIIELCHIMTGSTPPTNNLTYYSDEYLFVSPVDLNKGKYIYKSVKGLSMKGFSICRKYPKGSVLFTCIGSTIGKCGIAGKELTSNQQINAVLPSEKAESEYIYYQLLYTSPQIKQQAGEQAVPLVNKTQFGEHKILIPSAKTEQLAISNVLSDLDADINLLQQRLNKTQQIKKGMMQELLTGKSRLV